MEFRTHISIFWCDFKDFLHLLLQLFEVVIRFRCVTQVINSSLLEKIILNLLSYFYIILQLLGDKMRKKDHRIRMKLEWFEHNRALYESIRTLLENLLLSSLVWHWRWWN